MTRPRSRDPLTAATSAILIPFLRPNGFRRASNRLIARLTDGMCQFLWLHLSGWVGKDFRVHYVTLSLFCPRDFLVLQAGDCLQRPNGSVLWLPAQTHELADESMATVIRTCV